MREVAEGEIHRISGVSKTLCLVSRTIRKLAAKQRPGQVNFKRSALLQCQEWCSEGGTREGPLEGDSDNLGEDHMVAHRAGDARGDRWSECRCVWRFKLYHMRGMRRKEAKEAEFRPKFHYWSKEYWDAIGWVRSSVSYIGYLKYLV